MAGTVLDAELHWMPHFLLLVGRRFCGSDQRQGRRCKLSLWVSGAVGCDVGKEFEANLSGVYGRH